LLRKKESSFSEEKEAKRLLFSGGKSPYTIASPSRAALKKVFLLLFLQKKKSLAFACLTLAATAAAAQTQPPRVPKSAPQANAFEFAPWASLTPTNSGLIRAAPQNTSLDFAPHEDQTFITVFGKKKGPEIGPRIRQDWEEPAGFTDVATPQNYGVGPAANCAGSSYRTIGGQAATGADMVGAMGGGRC
jgi:hypothetical protein